MQALTDGADRAGAEPGRAWLARFEREQGRPLRVLHIGNIANNAYNNAKIQRRYGIVADVACLDDYHVMGSPEWEDADFEGELGDPFFPDWWGVDLKGYRRPRWFAQGRLPTCQRYLLALRGGRRLRTSVLWRRLTVERWLRSRNTRPARAMARVATRLDLLGLAAIFPPAPPGDSSPRRLRLRRYGRIAYWTIANPVYRGSQAMLNLSRQPRATQRTDPAVRYGELFPERSTPLAATDYASHAGPLRRWARLCDQYDVVQAYATHPLIPYLCGATNYVAYEHGTLRQIPFEDSSQGRLTALSYREAPVVFVTNPDVVPAAQRLGLEPAQIVLLPHAVDSDRLFRFADRHTALLPGPGDEVTFVSPTRQDWVDRDPSWTKANDRAIRALALVRDRGLRCRLLLADWGRDLGASKALVEELGVEDLVCWIPALRKGELWKAYLRAHAVADQFALPGISGVTFEALALGRRVLAHVGLELTRSFFGEEPPLLTCHEPEEIADAMERVIADPLDKERLGASARSWFERYHSSERIVELQASAYRRLLEGPTLRAT